MADSGSRIKSDILSVTPPPLSDSGGKRTRRTEKACTEGRFSSHGLYCLTRPNSEFPRAAVQLYSIFLLKVDAKHTLDVLTVSLVLLWHPLENSHGCPPPSSPRLTSYYRRFLGKETSCHNPANISAAVSTTVLIATPLTLIVFRQALFP